MSFKLVESKCVDLTLDLAKEFAALEPSPTERTLDPGRIKHLRAKADAKLLVTFHWAKVKYDGRQLRMNGQHSSQMLCELNGGFPKGLKCHLDVYSCETQEDLAMLFRQFDDRKSSRGASDVAGAYQGLYRELDCVPRNHAKVAIEGIAWHTRAVEGAPVPTGDDVFAWFALPQHWPFIMFIGELLGLKTPELKKKEIVAAMYATWLAGEDKAKDFWKSVARGGSEVDESDPAAALDNWYKIAKDKELKVAPKPAEYYQAGICGWNAFVEGKSIKTLKTSADKGFAIPLIAS